MENEILEEELTGIEAFADTVFAYFEENSKDLICEMEGKGYLAKIPFITLCILDVFIENLGEEIKGFDLDIKSPIIYTKEQLNSFIKLGYKKELNIGEEPQSIESLLSNVSFRNKIAKLDNDLKSFKDYKALYLSKEIDVLNLIGETLELAFTYLG
ncbi:MAG: hypothetical protein MJ238_05255 [Bacilli bacterium]|nr:hypothetical protein [Bacilli bacterium]